LQQNSLIGHHPLGFLGIDAQAGNQRRVEVWYAAVQHCRTAFLKEFGDPQSVFPVARRLWGACICTIPSSNVLEAVFSQYIRGQPNILGILAGFRSVFGKGEKVLATWKPIPVGLSGGIVSIPLL